MPKLIQWLYPERIWAFSHPKNTVYLTFDDGPIPEVTPWVLEELKRYKAKATFFCIGDNVIKNPEIFQKILSEGHSVGNHTFNHLNGWKTKTSEYVENVATAEKEIWSHKRKMTHERSFMSEERIEKWDGTEINATKDQNIENRQSAIVNRKSLFRPPYGKITFKQAKILQKRNFKIVMWDILSYDYDAGISEEECLQYVLKKIKPGSIIVFHDSLKAQKNLLYVLPKVLEFISEKGWKCSSIQSR